MSRSCAEPGAAGVLRRLIAGGPFSPADLVQIVGTGWCPRRFPTQSAALGWALHHLLAPEQRVVLGEMFETARARLDCEPGPLRLETAEALVRTWRLLAQRRAEEWHRPRRYRRRRDGHSELLVPDPSRVRR
ncbi:MAG TPA: hypothetical protein VFA11_13205 [Acidimicrobiales bacterium]|nr:hypothetical protein [Acidimicrobiales bacterium]